MVRLMRSAGLVGDSTEAEAYLRVATRTVPADPAHEWSDEIVERLRDKIR